MREALMSPTFRRLPLVLPLGDAALLIRFASQLSDDANRAAIAFAARLESDPPQGVLEIAPNLVSVLLRYDPEQISFAGLTGELQLRLGDEMSPRSGAEHLVPVRYGGDHGPDFDEVAEALGLSREELIEKHSAEPLRVLATGFAPGFVYCGFHSEALALPRRRSVRARVETGSVLFAAGQSAICATSIPTGWHVIGRTEFRNFDSAQRPPTVLSPGDKVRFVPC